MTYDKRFWFTKTKKKTCKDCCSFERIYKHDTNKGVMCGQCIEHDTPEESDGKICFGFN